MIQTKVELKLQISESEIDENVTHEMDRSTFLSICESELYQTACGVVDGQLNYRCDDWKEAFFMNLVKYNPEIKFKSNSIYSQGQ